MRHKITVKKEHKIIYTNEMNLWSLLYKILTTIHAFIRLPVRSPQQTNISEAKEVSPEPSSKIPENNLFFQDACLIISIGITNKTLTYLVPYDSHAPLLSAQILREKGVQFKVLNHHLNAANIRYKPYINENPNTQAFHFNFPTHFISVN